MFLLSCIISAPNVSVADLCLVEPVPSAPGMSKLSKGMINAPKHSKIELWRDTAQACDDWQSMIAQKWAGKPAMTISEQMLDA